MYINGFVPWPFSFIFCYLHLITIWKIGDVRFRKIIYFDKSSIFVNNEVLSISLSVKEGYLYEVKIKLTPFEIISKSNI